MATKGTFVLADIGGYTSFLNGVAIEHGKEITEDLLNTILRCNRERWQLANVEGDCIFFYREGLEPPTELVDHIRDIYKDFSQRTIDIAERAACPCGACTRTGELSLKFIVHAGEFETQKIGNRTELVGPDVVVAHRLLKNSVALDEYIIVTDSYATDPGAFGLPAQAASESFEGVGEVIYQQLDLQPVREELDCGGGVGERLPGHLLADALGHGRGVPQGGKAHRWCGPRHAVKETVQRLHRLLVGRVVQEPILVLPGEAISLGKFL